MPSYMAGGSPMGTDTVPMRATPGEFVMRKSAVDAFGVKVLSDMNRLDSRYLRSSPMAGGSTSVVHDNRTVSYSATIVSDDKPAEVEALHAMRRLEIANA